MKTAINSLARYIYQWANSKGWWSAYPQSRHQNDGEPRTVQLNSDQIASKLMLATSELAEALEIVRDPTKAITDIWTEDGKPEGFGIEIADAIIRLLDLSAALGINIGDCIMVKMGYNETRPYKHGGKTI